MPWHDVAMSVRGAAARAAQHFMNRWNRELAQLKTTAEARRGFTHIVPRWYRQPAANFSRDDYDASCQIVRSVGPWSFSSPVERSIYDAYLQCIATSEKFIYIENQFFVSGTCGGAVFNRIASAVREDTACC